MTGVSNRSGASEGTAVAHRARQTCRSCKLRKKKCDKALPTCSQCSKKQLRCEYSRPEGTRRSHASLKSESSFGDARTNAIIDLPSVLFLDPSILKYGQFELVDTTFAVPPYVLRMLGDENEVRLTTSKYFDRIHQWMPFVSKQRLYEVHLRSSYLTRPDVVLLLLCMKLAVTAPPSTQRAPQTALYGAVKQLLLELEASSELSLPVLQSMVLLSLYESGHAIHPAAFLTTGACARYANALGIGVSVQSRIVLTMVEIEERRRVWWSIVILDRFVSIGSPGRPFATADPQPNDFFPLDDKAWDAGIVEMDHACTLASPMTTHMSRFALLCQGARLLGQVIQHISNPAAVDDETWMQLDRTLQAMITASLNVDQPDSDQISFLYSSLVALYTPWLTRRDLVADYPSRYKRAMEVVEQISTLIESNLVGQQCFVGRDIDGVSPWGLFFAYHICLISQGSERTILKPEVARELKATLVKVDARWNLAGAYLQLLEAHMVINKMP